MGLWCWIGLNILVVGVPILIRGVMWLQGNAPDVLRMEELVLFSMFLTASALAEMFYQGISSRPPDPMPPAAAGFLKKMTISFFSLLGALVVLAGTYGVAFANPTTNHSSLPLILAAFVVGSVALSIRARFAVVSYLEAVP